MRSEQSGHIVGLYCRLSRDDGSDGPSMSIENQKQLLLDYVTERGWKVYDFYVDDGLTGTNFERPDFKRMKQDIEDGKIDCVITKDLSRLGRNFVQTGYYTDEYFPERGVRYIAINDNIDTANDDNDMAGFYHVMNEFYPKQVSKKIKQVKRSAMKQGKFIGGKAPYGYMKSPEDKHKLLIDAAAAPIVRRIFEEFGAGESARCIADRLTQERIDSPQFHHYKRTETYPPQGKKNAWLSGTIYQMLRNPVYIGNMAQGKRQVTSFKTKRRRVVPPEDWVIVPNTHEAIIEKVVWDVVLKRVKTSVPKARRLRSTGELSLFSGLLKCADCGANLAYTEQELKKSVAKRYRCQGYMSKGKGVCSSHNIREGMLVEIVLNDIRRYARLTKDERAQIATDLMQAQGQKEQDASDQLSRKLQEASSRLEAIDTLLKKLYEDRCAGVIAEDMFRDMMGSYTAEKTELQTQHKENSAELERSQEAEQDITAWLTLVSQYEDIDSLDRSTVQKLLESVEMQESFDADGKRHLEFWINYRFIGKISQKTERNALNGVPLDSIAC